MTKNKTRAESRWEEAKMDWKMRVLMALKREDLEICDSLTDVLPINGEYFSGYSAYTWVKPLTAICAEKLNDVFLSDLVSPINDYFTVNKWMCIEETEDGIFDIISVESMMEDIKTKFKCLGIKVLFE